MEQAYRWYKCVNCGHEQQIKTNHLGRVIDYCKECSWKPSFGKHAVPFNGRTYRPFDFVRDLDAPPTSDSAAAC